MRRKFTAFIAFFVLCVYNYINAIIITAQIQKIAQKYDLGPYLQLTHQFLWH